MKKSLNKILKRVYKEMNDFSFMHPPIVQFIHDKKIKDKIFVKIEYPGDNSIDDPLYDYEIDKSELELSENKELLSKIDDFYEEWYAENVDEIPYWKDDDEK